MSPDDTPTARPTTYAGIQMRSRLEADYAAHLDSGDAIWKYEPKCFAGPGGQWLPDFSVGTDVYVELKPAGAFDLGRHGEIDEILKKMQIAWLSEPNAVLHLVLWEYPGRPQIVLSASGDHRIWCVTGPGGVLWIWPGMEQTMDLGRMRRPTPTVNKEKILEHLTGRFDRGEIKLGDLNEATKALDEAEEANRRMRGRVTEDVLPSIAKLCAAFVVMNAERRRRNGRNIKLANQGDRGILNSMSGVISAAGEAVDAIYAPLPPDSDSQIIDETAGKDDR